jgi:hypothetical protein
MSEEDETHIEPMPQRRADHGEVGPSDAAAIPSQPIKEDRSASSVEVQEAELLNTDAPVTTAHLTASDNVSDGTPDLVGKVGKRNDPYMHNEGVIHLGSGNVNVYDSFNSVLDRDLGQAKEIFLHSLKHRDEFVASFLKQALHQALTTFRMSLVFMAAGGIIVLIAGAMALANQAAPANHSVALVSGLGGIIVGICGAAFSLKADKARKHLAAQAERMHSQLLDERKFVQVAELLSGIKNEDVNDRARVALALRLLGDESSEATSAARAESS